MTLTESTFIDSVVFSFVLCCFSGCAASQNDMEEQPHVKPGCVHHVVICWLRDSGNEEHRRKLIEASRGFKDIPGIAELRAGRVLPGERSIVDSSFDIAVIMTFRSEQDMKNYLSHPEHEKARDEILVPLTDRIVVYDIIE